MLFMGLVKLTASSGPVGSTLVAKIGPTTLNVTVQNKWWVSKVAYHRVGRLCIGRSHMLRRYNTLHTGEYLALGMYTTTLFNHHHRVLQLVSNQMV